jgi:hypothetical protein
MLQPAIKYESQLRSKMVDITFDERFMFMFGSSYRDEIVLDNTTWNKHQFVSVNKNGEVIGFFQYNINRDCLDCYGLQIVNFKNDRLTPCFSKDLRICIRDIFYKFNFRKLGFSVVVGNPAEKFYDKYIHKIGGRIVGIKREEVKMLDGSYYDMKLYEVLREDFLKEVN